MVTPNAPRPHARQALWVCLAALPAAAQAWQLTPSRSALGEPVTLTLSARPGVLETLDLAPLARDFEIQGRTLNRSGGAETLALTLYPLHVGRLALPGLGLPGRPPTLEVAAQSAQTPKVRLTATLEPAQPYARQPVRLTLEACDDGSLDWKRPLPPTRAGLHLRALSERQLDVERDGERCTAHRWDWAVLPAVAGRVTLPLPMLEAGKLGRRLRFPPPAVELDAQAPPPWLPDEAAIGAPAARVKPLPARWPLQRPLAWRIEITGGYSAEALKGLLALQLAAPLLRHPPEVRALPAQDASPLPRHAVTLHLMPEQTGPLRLPELALPWYDPASGQVQTLVLPGREIEVFNPLHARLGYAGLAVLGLAAAALGGRALWRAWRWRLARRRGLAAIARAATLAELLAAVRRFALDTGQPPAATLGGWGRTLRAEGLPELRQALERTAYGRAGVTEEVETVEALRRRALETLGGAVPGLWR